MLQPFEPSNPEAPNLSSDCFFQIPLQQGGFLSLEEGCPWRRDATQKQFRMEGPASSPLEKGKKARQRSQSVASNASLQWRKKEIPTDKEKEERNKWLDDKEKKPHHQEMKETLEEGDADKQSSSSSTPEMGNTSEKGKASKKGGTTEKDGASEKAGTPEKGKEPEKNEPGTASGSRSTLEEGETISRGDLKRVMVDFHNTLETGNIITKSNGEALVKLLDAGYQVCICSYCFENRRGKVERQLNEQPWRDRVWKVMFTQKRVKHPEAKSSLCRVWGMKALFDDSWDILEDALEKGVACYPIRTKYENHMWFKNHGKAEGPWNTFADAVEAFLAREAEWFKAKTTAT